VLYNVAQFHWHRGEYQQAFDAAQQSLGVAERLNDSAGIARAFEMLALACHSLGEWQDGLRFEAKRATLAGSGLDVTEAFDVHLWLWEYHLYGDKGYEEVKQAVSTTLAEAQRIRAPRAIAFCRCFDGALEFQAGHWEAAEISLRESIRLHREIGAASGEALACQRLGVLLTAQGHLDEARMILEEGLLVAEHALLRAHCLTRLYAALARNRLVAGDMASAAEALGHGLAMSERHGHCTTCDALLLPAAIGVRAAQKDWSAAEAFCQKLDEAAAEYGSRTWLAMARQARGELAAAQGKRDEALAYYAEAQAVFSLAGNLAEAERCQTQINLLKNELTQHATKRRP
jgi:tetratricopeptide (TPR) repeat protein